MLKFFVVGTALVCLQFACKTASSQTLSGGVTSGSASQGQLAPVSGADPKDPGQLGTHGTLSYKLGRQASPILDIFTTGMALDNFWDQRDNFPHNPCFPVTYLTQGDPGGVGICMNWVGRPAAFNHKGTFLFGYGNKLYSVGSSYITLYNNNKLIGLSPGFGLHLQKGDNFLGFILSASLSSDKRIWKVEIDGGTKTTFNARTGGDSAYTTYSDILTVASATTTTEEKSVTIQTAVPGIEPGMIISDRDAQLGSRGGVLGTVLSVSGITVNLTTKSAYLVHVGDRLVVSVPGVGGGGSGAYWGITNTTPKSQVVAEGLRVSCNGLSRGCLAFDQDVTAQLEVGSRNSDFIQTEYDSNNHSGVPRPGSYGIFFQSTSEEPIGSPLLVSSYTCNGVIGDSRNICNNSYFDGINFHAGIANHDVTSNDYAHIFLNDSGMRLGHISGLVPSGVGLFLDGVYESQAIAIALPHTAVIGGNPFRSNGMVTWVDSARCSDGTKCAGYHTFPTSFEVGAQSEKDFLIGPPSSPVDISSSGAVAARGPIASATYTVAELPLTCVPGQTAYASNGRKTGEALGAGSGVPVICTLSHTNGTPQWWSLFGEASSRVRN